MRRALLAGLVLLAGCGPKAIEPPEDPNSRLTPGREMMLYSDKHDPVLVLPDEGELIEAPVGTAVMVVADIPGETKDGRVIRIRIKEGRSAGVLGTVDRNVLRPPVKPAN